MYIDTHAHLNFEAFKSDYREAINRAQENDIHGIINVGSNLATSKKAIEIANEFPGLYAGIGLHPIHVKDEEFDEAAFLKMAKNKKVVALGETGLDYYYDKSMADLQKEVFQKLLKMASVISKPVILHSRDAGEDVLSILMQERSDTRGVMHCFQGGWPYAKMILDMGLYISFTGLVTFSKNYETFEVIENTPLERLLIETDCPYMTPRPLTPELYPKGFLDEQERRSDGGRAEPYRGKRNEPAYVAEVAKKIAELKKISLEKVAEKTSQNAIDLFGLKI